MKQELYAISQILHYLNVKDTNDKYLSVKKICRATLY